MAQTAVEYLVEELLSGKPLMPSLIEQAKAMEKKQIINAIDSQYNYDKWLKELPTLGEQYYNETFKSE